MAAFGRDFIESSGPTHMPKQGYLEQIAQDLVQEGFEYLQRRRICSLSGQPVPALRQTQTEEALPHVQLELPLLQFVPGARCWAPLNPSLLRYQQQVLVLHWETPVGSGESCRAAEAAAPLSDAPVESRTQHRRRTLPAFPGAALCLEKCHCPSDTCLRRDICPFSSDRFPLLLQV